jgi:hypothetical protein
MGYKERLVMLSVDPQKGSIRGRTSINTLLFFASLFELADKGLLRIEDGRWTIREGVPEDPVLKKVAGILASKNGKRTRWVLNNVPLRISSLFRLLRDHMLERHLITAQPLHFLFWRVGYRYRVVKQGLVLREFTPLERVLIYGRDPDPGTHVMILLLGAAGLHKSLFAGTEYRRKARQRMKELRKQPGGSHPETYQTIGKELFRMLRSQKQHKTF